MMQTLAILGAANEMSDLTIFLLIAAGVIIWWLASQLSSLKDHMQTEVQARVQAWIQREIASVKIEQREIAEREAHVKLEQWQRTKEVGIRSDAVKRSQSVIIGKVTEQLVPYLPEFKFNPKDARFIGSPVDFLVFDGLSDGAVTEVVFVEVKSGNAAVTDRES